MIEASRAGLLADRVMKSRRPGWCPLCSGPVLTGQRIGRTPDHGWCHVLCIVTRYREAA